MFKSLTQFFKKFKKIEKEDSKSTAKERLHLVLAQDRANISADFLELMKQEILEVIKKYIDIDEKAIDVRLTNKESEDGSVGAPALYANIPIITIKNEARKLEGTLKKDEDVNDKQRNQDDAIDSREMNIDNTNEKNEDNREVDEKEDDDAEENSYEEIKSTENEEDKLDNNNLDEVDDEEKNS